MRKTRYYMAAALLAAVSLGSCLEKQDIMPPVITVSGSEKNIQYFSTVQPAKFDVKVESGEDLKYFTVSTFPLSSWNDTTITYPPYTHTASHSFSFLMSRGHTVARDSVYTLSFAVHTADTSCIEKRKLKFKFVYPEVDSFDVVVGSQITDYCLIDVEKKTAYKYTQYMNIRTFDLVYINDQRKRAGNLSIGNALCSPTANVLVAYFAAKCPDVPYDFEKYNLRQTMCGSVFAKSDGKESETSLTWKDFNSVMLGMEEGWLFPTYLLNTPDYGFGFGVSNINQSKLYKFKLQSGRYAMVKVLKMYNSAFDDSEVTLRVYFQKIPK